ncbi:MAG TPA: ParB/RepB/Spo0J family partition protein [Clostridiaceae bacterium]|nr:ParB/RepB/Spo0J family partition protein [Clostridiaceae bacterium]
MNDESTRTKLKRGLGKGLGALFEAVPEEEHGTESDRIIELSINRIEPNREQPRQDFDEERLDELTESIRDQGVISPLIVMPTSSPDRYMIVAGERRWRAARAAGLHTVPVIIRDLTEAEAQRQALIDNVVREDLNAIEEAFAFDQLIKQYDMTQESLARAIGKSRSAITNTLRLLNLPENIRDMVRQGELSSGHARALLALSDASAQSDAAAIVLAKQLSVRDTERLVKEINAPSSAPVQRTPADERKDLHIRTVEEQLRRSLGTKVTIQDKKTGRGNIVICYHSADELERLLELLIR